MLDEDKHTISVLTEGVLYRRLRAFNESDDLDEETKEERKKEAIDLFVKEYAERNELLSEDEIRETVKFVLKRTEDNIKRMKDK